MIADFKNAQWFGFEHAKNKKLGITVNHIVLTEFVCGWFDSASVKLGQFWAHNSVPLGI